MPATEAVAALGAQKGLICTKMLKDLSAPAPNQKDFRQKGISSFFKKESMSGLKHKDTMESKRNDEVQSSVMPESMPDGEGSEKDIPSAPDSPVSGQHSPLKTKATQTVSVKQISSGATYNGPSFDKSLSHKPDLKATATIHKNKTTASPSRPQRPLKKGQSSITKFFNSK